MVIHYKRAMQDLHKTITEQYSRIFQEELQQMESQITRRDHDKRFSRLHGMIGLGAQWRCEDQGGKEHLFLHKFFFGKIMYVCIAHMYICNYYLSIYSSIYPFNCLYHLSIHVPIQSSIFQSIYLSIYSSLHNLSLLIHPPPPFPLGIQRFVFCVYVSISALQIGSSVPFFQVPCICINT